MYSACMFCRRHFETNEAIEHCSIGRCFAFDARKGRLWIVCGHCGRWNLSPLEERWEAIEDCERLYVATLARVATANIGLARLRDGVRLIRVGAPPRAEMAAWRYGVELLGRHRRALAKRALLRLGSVVYANELTELLASVGAVVAVEAVAPGLNPLWGLGAGVGGFGLLWAYLRKSVVWLRTTSGATIPVRRLAIASVGVVTGEDAELSIRVPDRKQQHILRGEEARRGLASILVHANAFGATSHQVDLAVSKLAHFGSAEEYIRFVTHRKKEADALHTLGQEQRLALEMALHEEDERRALEGELAALEAAWREAEEIATLADDLLVPAGIVRRLSELRRRRSR